MNFIPSLEAITKPTTTFTPLPPFQTVGPKYNDDADISSDVFGI